MKHKQFGKVTAVPMAERAMTNWDMFATWIGANANNGTWYIGGVIAAAGMLTASTTLIITGVLSYILLALASYMGYKTGLPAMVLTRASFGLRGSFIPSIINLVQFIGWAAANTFIAAISISVIFKDLFGWAVYGSKGGNFGLILGIVIMSILHLISISLGEKSVRMIERVGIILVFIFVIWETVVVLKTVSLQDIMQWHAPAKVAMTSGAAVDVLAAFNLAWVTAAADFSRFTPKKQAATTLSFLGANIGLFWFTFVGLMATIATAITLNAFDPNNSDPSTIASKLGLGSLALVVIIITSTTANAVNLMAAGSALTNMFHKLRLTPALWLVTIGATIVSFIPLVVASFLDSFIVFLDAIGMFLGPEIAVFLVDFFLVRKGAYVFDEFTKIDGAYWYNKGVNWVAIIAWVLGVSLYFGLKKISFIADTIGATFVSMALTAAIYYVAAQFIMNSKRGTQV
ncbi:cytosine permease [Weissella soli]|uniref:NCS1 family nucleobase:cation symporter-1 n=1 Tax=Weissella soli TaxID=155866 RepID=A0A288Q5M2_9LACO|nr:cytosine permease [Weissella soli]AOT55927.1 Nicotinamide riboside transporter [Weissella soli]MCT8394546.1 cytosine permease [Weissella soli]NKY83825.1 cytosine permease [Weissella soli]QEA35148.1 cytosine permease [Weissella soli]RDL01531.1 NCS1 family nucleobase:cation symporter-1 [Weissella soli]